MRRGEYRIFFPRMEEEGYAKKKKKAHSRIRSLIRLIKEEDPLHFNCSIDDRECKIRWEVIN